VLALYICEFLAPNHLKSAILINQLYFAIRYLPPSRIPPLPWISAFPPSPAFTTFNPHIFIAMSEFNYPLISSIHDIVPRPFTEEVPPPPGVTVLPNSLRLVRKVSGVSPSFPTHPATFTIPGSTIREAMDFVEAMQSTVYWAAHRTKHNPPLNSNRKAGGRPTEVRFKLDYQCPCAGLLTPVPDTRKKHFVSRRCGCEARFSVSLHIETNTLRVTWFWRHNHDPHSLEAMEPTRIPRIVAKWLQERMNNGVGWAQLQKLLHSDDLLLARSATTIPESLYIQYDQVRYLIRKQIRVLGKKDEDIFKSLALWNAELQRSNWNTYYPTAANSPGFIFAFQSAWQKEQMILHGKSMLMLDATHNTVSNYSLGDGRKVSLYTFMIRDPLVGKGLPVCWAFTCSLAQDPIQLVLSWLRYSASYVPRAIMSDCALAIRNAIEAAYEDMVDPPKHYWCVFHVLKAYRTRATTYVNDHLEEAVADFRHIMYSRVCPSQLWDRFAAKWGLISPQFLNYVTTQWQQNIVRWAMYYRVSDHQGIHTNNYTESWHRILKTHYLPPPERRRMDEVVQIFRDDVLPSYQRNTARVELGFQKQTTNKYQLRSKMLAKSYTPDSLRLIGAALIESQSHFTIGSFTNPLEATWTITRQAGQQGGKDRLTTCTCPHFRTTSSACKHMYYVAQQHRLLVVEEPDEIEPEPDIESVLEMLDQWSWNEANNFALNTGTASSSHLARNGGGPGYSENSSPEISSPEAGCRQLPELDLGSTPDARETRNIALVPPVVPFSTGRPRNLHPPTSSSDIYEISSVENDEVEIISGGRNSRGRNKRARREESSSSGTTNTTNMTAKEIQKEVSLLQAAGLRAIKRVEEHLRDAKIRKSFGDGCSVAKMELFRDTALDNLALVEEVCGIRPRKQIR